MALELRAPTTRTVGRLLTLVVIALLAALFQYLGRRPGLTGNTMLLGFLLLAAFVAGEVAREVRLPRITGYMVIGLLFGPHIMGLLPQTAVTDFRLINDVALSVIALQAGGELRFHRVHDRFRSIALITFFQIVIVAAGTTLVVSLGRDLVPFLADAPFRSIIAVALIFGIVAVAKSPATTIAVITEMRARGPLTDTVLGVSVFKDVIILLLLAVVLPTAAVLANPTLGFDFTQLEEISLSIVMALGLGCVVGLSIMLYLKHVRVQPILFVLAAAFGVVELAHGLGLESESYILMGMAAGFVVQNLSVQGAKFIDALEANSLPLYALFFALAGADLELGVVPQIWRAALLILVARLALTYASTTLGAVAAGDSLIIRRYAWMGFLAKAGVTLGIAHIVRERFPEWGEPVAAIIIAMVAVNQLIGPPLFRLAIVRAGEAG
jgi:Kef-type K+ transport system membrane component KefB